jgi:hypothetical protein
MAARYTHGTARLLQARAPLRHHGSMTTQPLKAPRFLKATVTQATPRCGHQMAVWLNDDCGSSRHHGGAAQRQCDFSKDHGDTTPQGAQTAPRQWQRGQAPSRQRRCGLTTAGLDLDPPSLDLGSSFLFLKSNV